METSDFLKFFWSGMGSVHKAWLQHLQVSGHGFIRAEHDILILRFSACGLCQS